MGALAGVTLVCWLMGDAVGAPALHGDRLRTLMERLVDTPVRGLVYEAGGDGRPRAAGARRGIVREASATWQSPGDRRRRARQRLARGDDGAVEVALADAKLAPSARRARARSASVTSRRSRAARSTSPRARAPRPCASPRGGCRRRLRGRTGRRRRAVGARSTAATGAGEPPTRASVACTSRRSCSTQRAQLRRCTSSRGCLGGAELAVEAVGHEPLRALAPAAPRSGATDRRSAVRAAARSDASSSSETCRRSAASARVRPASAGNARGALVEAPEVAHTAALAVAASAGPGGGMGRSEAARVPRARQHRPGGGHRRGRLREGCSGRDAVGGGPPLGRLDPHRRGGREPGAVRRGPHPRGDRIRLEAGPSGPGQARLPGPGRVRRAVRQPRHLQRPHGRALRGPQQLVRRLHVLVPALLRARQRQADERPAREVDLRGPADHHRRAQLRAAAVQRAGGRRRDPRQARRGARRARRRAPAWWTCARRRSTRAS